MSKKKQGNEVRVQVERDRIAAEMKVAMHRWDVIGNSFKWLVLGQGQRALWVNWAGAARRFMEKSFV